MAGVTVKLTDDAGSSITGTTASNGTVTLTPGTSLTGGKYRVEVVNPRPGVLHPAFASRQGLTGAPLALSSTEEFVDLSGGKKQEFTTGFWNPGDFCQKNADVVTACEPNDINGGPLSPVDPANRRTLVTYPYNATSSTLVKTVSDKATTGALYGIGYSKQSKRIFSGALAKRGSGYGPGGAGAIYVTDRANNATTVFATVPNAGTTTHNMTTLTDLAFQPAAGKESLGDVEVSEDGEELYVVNLFDRKLYVYDATLSTATEPKASYTIPDPSCASANDWRPFGLGVQDGVVYVGGVCSAESTRAKNDLRAVIRKFNPAAGTFSAPVMDERLAFSRGIAFATGACSGAGWFPWSDTTPRTQNGKNCQTSPIANIANPEPELADIVVETNGDLIVSFRDRFADQTGFQVHMWADDPKLQDGSSGGDLNRACPGGAGGLFLMDGNGGCRAGGGSWEYYDGDTRFDIHEEATFGGVALSKVETTLGSQIIDPKNEAPAVGTAWFNRVTGVSTPATSIQLTRFGFGKAGGVGDLEVLCDEAPIQIGNRLWFDKNGNGVQDPSELPVPNATVSLYDGETKVGTSVTSVRGEYYFDNSNVTGGLLPNKQYTIKVDKPTDYAAGGPLAGWSPTVADAGSNDALDSDGEVPAGELYPEHTITTGTAGQDNHSYDFGFVQADPKIRITKQDTLTNSAADTEATRVQLPNTNDVQLNMTITNTGTEPLVKVEVEDVVVRGGTIKDLSCTWPDGSKTTDPTGKHVAWADSFTGSPLKQFAPAASYSCTATLTGLQPGEPHHDESTVKGEGAFSHKGVQDTNPWHSIPPADLRVIKKDAKTGKLLGGAVFEAWRESNGTPGLQTTGTPVDTKITPPCTTNPQGECTFHVPPGEYYLVETAAPTGYPKLVQPVVSGPHRVVEGGGPAVPVELVNEPPVPTVQIIKKDTPTNSDANTEATRVQLPNTNDVPLNMTITNNGAEPLVKLEVTDVVTKGTATVKDLSCTWPDGSVSTDPAGKLVRWEASHREQNRLQFAVGASYKCTAILTGLKPGEAHTDESTVNGEGAISGTGVHDTNPWNGIPPADLRVIKKDAKSPTKVLAGAVFEAWRESNGTEGLQTTGTSVDTKITPPCTTNPQGECAFHVPPGDYYLVETVAPPGYPKPVPPVSGPHRVGEGVPVVTVELVNEPPVPTVQIIKKDTPTNSDANTEATRVQLPNSNDVPLNMTITNNGAEPLVKLEVTDVVTQGTATVKDLSCTWPDGTKSTDPAGKLVRWEASHREQNRLQFAVGASYKCTAILTGLKPGEPHTDESTVNAEGAISGTGVHDTNPWNGIPPADLRLIKKDAKNGKLLAGAVFEAWRETNGQEGLQTTGTPVDTKITPPCTTNPQGECTFHVPPGEYYLVETAAPTGYPKLVQPVVSGPHRVVEGGGPAVPVELVNEPPVPTVQIIKKDTPTNSDANTEATRVQLPNTNDVPLNMTITNNGAEPLVKLEVTDVVTKGTATVKDLSCTWPDGSVSTDPAGKLVRWEASHREQNRLQFAVGASYKCTAILTGLKAGEAHTDESTVNGEGAISGTGVHDTNPWNGIPPGEIRVIKKDAKHAFLLGGAVFELWRETNSTPGLQTTGTPADTKIGDACKTDIQGVCTFSAQPGDYYLREVTPPPGYPNPAQPVSGPHHVTEGVTLPPVELVNEPPVPTVQIIKKDTPTNSDADTEATRVRLPNSNDVPLNMTITNNGAEPLVKVEVTDVVTQGTATVKDLSCTWPDGTKSTDPAGKAVRWEASHREQNRLQFAVGASYKCTAILTGLKPGEPHTDESTVNGEGAISGTGVHDTNPWNGIPPADLRVIKKDENTGKPLAGAVFKLWRESNNVEGLQKSGTPSDTSVGTCRTDAKGECGFAAPSGTYYVEEITAPAGYPMPSEPVSGPHEVTDTDKVIEVPRVNKQHPKVQIIKKDTPTGSDANDEATRVKLPDTKDVPLNMTITNNGTEPLVKVEVTDVVTKGTATVKDLSCTWPDGTKSTDPAGKLVRWEASHREQNRLQFAVGASYKCTAILTGLKPGEAHTDESTVNGEGAISGTGVTDTNPWNGIPPVELRLIKKDAKNGKLLAGAVFELWNETNGKEGLQTTGTPADKRIGTCTTSAQGVCTFLAQPGGYYLKEITPPKGYPKPAHPISELLTIADDDTVVEIEQLNEPPVPVVLIVKKDTQTGSDADTEATRVKLPNTNDVPLTMTITNTGTEPLVKVEVKDVVTKGTAKIKDLACTWPDGTKTTDANGESVRWADTFGDSPTKQLAIGQSYTCTAILTGLKPGEAHTDESTVNAEGVISGTGVHHTNPWHGIPPVELRVIKKDAETGKPLAGAVFELWSETNNLEGLQTTVTPAKTPEERDIPADKRHGACTTTPQGVCKFDVQPGDYYLHETTAPTDYPKPVQPTSGLHHITDDDTVVEIERTNKVTPSIVIIKKDTPTGSDANDEATRVKLPDTKDVPLNMTITNNGTEPLVKVEVSDVVTEGTATVKDLSCTWPDGTVSTDATGKAVRWEPSFTERPKRFEAGASYKCTATLTGLKAGEAHTDNSTVRGEGVISHKEVTSQDPWKSVPPGKFIIEKKDAKTGKPLARAVFELWRESNNRAGLQYTGTDKDTRIDSCTTDTQGRCEFPVVAGTYYLLETSVPEGYQLPKQPVSGPYELTSSVLTRPFTAKLTNHRGEPGKGPKR
ncbi:SpaA isopeptide-forming pilin-related protein [Streptomyces sp. NBC_00435]|uniref:SpaA isopeptide-forming pilin-related protein n=1 Tax=Streptomyces sp. NBC_00435 TaxID=2903649 RepID=UPI002E1B762F